MIWVAQNETKNGSFSKPDGWDNASDEDEKVEGHQDGVGDHEAGVLPHGDVESKEGSEEHGYASQNQHQGDNQELHCDHLQHVDAIETHQARPYVKSNAS